MRVRPLSGGFRRDKGIYEVWQDLKVKAALEETHFHIVVHGKRLVLAKSSLHFFRPDHPTLHSIRYWAVWITEWLWFERLIIAVIALNCVILALPMSYDPDSATESERNALFACNGISMLLFTAESILKIIARGLFFQQAPDPCYLREPLNWLDLAVVVSSWLELLFLGEEDADSQVMLLVRTFRVLRPLRSIQVLPHLRMIVMALVESAPLVGHWLFFAGLIFSVIAVAGINLFGVVYWQRCRLTEAPVPGVDGSPEWPVDPAQPRFCGGRRACAAAPGGEATRCASPVSFGSALEGLDPWPELLENPGADLGYSGFQSFASALLTTFQVSTGDGWTELLYRFQDGAGDFLALTFFCCLVLFGGLVLLNFVPAIFWERFVAIQHRDTAQGHRRKGLENRGIPQEILSMKLHELVEVYARKEKVLRKSRVQEQVNQDLTGIGLKPLCLYICSRPLFENFFLVLVIINTVILSFESHPPIDSVVLLVFDRINMFCTCLFVLEVVIKLIGLGVNFFGEHLNLFDLVLVAVSIYEVFENGTGATSALRTARLLRVFKFEAFQVNVAIRVLQRVLHKAIVPTYSFAVLVLLYLYCMTLLGLQLFFPKEEEQQLGMAHFPRFDSPLWAFVSSFALLSGEAWSSGMLGHLQAAGQDTATVLAFHLVSLVLGHLLLVSNLVGIFASCFADAREELLQDYRRKLADIQQAAQAPAEPEQDEAQQSAAMAQGSPQEFEPESPLWPKDVTFSREGPQKTSKRGMNVLRMMQLKQAAANRRMAAGGTVTFRGAPPPTAHSGPGRRASSAKGRGPPGRRNVGFQSEKSDVEAVRASYQLMQDTTHGAAPPLPPLAPEPAPQRAAGANAPAAAHPSSPTPGPEAAAKVAMATASGCAARPEVAAPPPCGAQPLAAPARCRPTSGPLAAATGERLQLRRPPTLLAQPAARPPPPSPRSVLAAGLGPGDGGTGLRRRLIGPNTSNRASSREGAQASFRELVRRSQVAEPKDPSPMAVSLASLGSRDASAVPIASREARGPCNSGDEELPRRPPGLRSAIGCHGAPAPASPSLSHTRTMVGLGDGASAAPANPGLSRKGTMVALEDSASASEHRPAVAKILSTTTTSNPSGCARSVAASPIFEPSILVLTIVSSVCLAFESPYREPSEKIAVLFIVIDVTAVAVFTVEMVIKIVAFGLVTSPVGLPPWAEPGYFRVGWNYIDFAAVVSGLTDIVLKVLSLDEDASKPLKLVRSLRALRVMRAARFVKSYRGAKIIVEALLNSVPTLLNAVLIVAFFYLGFGILLVNLLKGELWHCSLDPTGEQRPHIVSRDDCLAAGGDWVNAQSNFDHMGNSMVTLLHVGTGQGWIDVMLAIVSSVGVNKQPRPNSRVYLSLLIVTFVALSNFVLLNLCIGVLIDSYMAARHEFDGVDLLSWEERHWVTLQRRVFFEPKLVLPPEAALKGERWLYVRTRLQKVTASQCFEAFLMISIFGSAVSACAVYPLQSARVLAVCQVASSVFASFITLEVVLKLFTLQMGYLRDPWSVYALVVAVVSDVSVLVDMVNGPGYWVARSLRVARTLRLMRFAEKARAQHALFCTLLSVLPGLAHVLALLVLVLFIFACLGVGLFGTLSWGEALGPDANFHGFTAAFLLLIRVATGDRWHALMYDVVTSQPNCTAELQSPRDLERDGPRGCGTPLGYAYFTVFVVVVSTVLMNLIIAVVMDSFQEVQQLNSLKFFEGQVLQLSKAWRQRDCPFTGYLKLDEVVSLLLDIPEPVGFAGGGGSRRHVLHQMRWMRLYSDKTVHYRDVVMLSAKRSCLWLRSDYEKNLGSVSFEASALEQWKNHFEAMPRATVHRMRRLSMGSVDSTLGPTDSMDSTAFFERRAAHMDSKYEILIGHVICGAYISAYADRKRRQWMLDSQGELGARRQALEEGRALVASQGRWTVGPKDAEPPAIVPTRDVQVAIVSARGLRNADGGYGTSDSYCRCNVLGKPRQWIQTEVISSTEPTWNHEAELLDVAEGEHLEFAVYDDDFGSKTHEVLGQAVLESAHFHPQGFDGELRLDNAGPGQEAFLSIRVAPAPGDAAGAAASDGIGLGGPYPSEQAAAKEPAQPNILVTQLLPPPESSAVQQLSPLPWPPTLPQLQPEKK